MSKMRITESREILYGLPRLWDPELQRQLKEEIVVLGGDAIVVAECRDWRCVACDHQWGMEVVERIEAYDREWSLEKAAREAAQAVEEEAAAIRRGVLDAVLEPDDVWTTCPHCRHEFSIYNKNSWMAKSISVAGPGCI